MKRKVPAMTTDEAAEAFLEQDLSDIDFAQFKPLHFEFETKTARVNMRLPERQLKVLKAEAKKRGVPYQRLMRDLLDRGLRDLKAS